MEFAIVLFLLAWCLIAACERGWPLYQKFRQTRRDSREKKFESEYNQHIQLNQLDAAEKQMQANLQSQRMQQKNHSARLNQLGRQLQIVFMQLPKAPDAQRLLSWSQRCKPLPSQFRRQQFSRFQNLLMEQIPRWLRGSVDREQLEQDLRSIAENLGVATFEAEYMIRAMQPATGGAAGDSQAFSNRLTQIQNEYQRRLQTIERLSNLSPDVREELIEAENQRYRSMLFGHDGEEI